MVLLLRPRLLGSQDEPIRKPDLILTEREHNLAVIDKDGRRRVQWLPPYAGLPNSNFRTSPIVTGNMFVDALGRRWLGSIQTGSVMAGTDHWAAARWNVSLRSFEPQFDIYDQTATLRDNDSGNRPRVIMIAEDPNGPNEAGILPLYLVVWSKGEDEVAFNYNAFIVKWAGDDIIIDSDQVDPSDFHRRTNTPDLRGSEADHYGWGNIASLLVDHDLTRWKLEQTPEFKADYHDATAAAGHNADQPGYGRFWAGWPVAIFFYSTRWYALCDGYIYDMADQDTPLESPSVGRAAYAVWQLNEGEEPHNANAWRFLRAFAPYNVDEVGLDLPSHATIRSSPHAWVVQYAGQVFFNSTPIMSITADGDSTKITAASDYTYIYRLDGGGFTPSLEFIDDSCEAGPIVNLDGTLYAMQISVSEQALYIFEYDNADGVWNLDREATDFGSTAHVALSVTSSGARIQTAFAQNGKIHVVYGRRSTVFDDQTADAGPPSSTAWEMKTWTKTSGAWVTLQHTYPAGASADDFGIWGRLFPFKFTGPGGVDPGPGGGTGGGSGPCDDTFFPFGTSTISKAVFHSVMVSYSSPLASISDSLYDYAVSQDVNAAFVLALWTHESAIGSNPGEMAGYYNVDNIRPEGWGRQTGTHVTDCCGIFGTYASWEDGALDGIDLVNLPAYDGTTISEFIAIHSPAFENDVTTYVNQVCARMAQWASDSGL
jgi:hypothetical protein